MEGLSIRRRSAHMLNAAILLAALYFLLYKPVKKS